MKLAVRLIAIVEIFAILLCAAGLWTRHYEEENKVILAMSYVAGRKDVVKALDSNVFVRAITYIQWTITGRFDFVTFSLGELY